MRLIGNVTDHKHAERFIAYLVTQGIQSHIEPEDEEFEIWIKDEDSLDQAITELQEFRKSPDAEKYLEAPNKAREIQNEMIRKRKRMVKNVVTVSDQIGRKNHSLTIMLMAVAGLVSLLTNFGHDSRVVRAPFRSLAFTSEHLSDLPEAADTESLTWRLKSVLDGEIWRLVTPIFLHFSVFHLLFNVYWLYFFGSQIENRYGTFWFGMLVLGSAVISNFIQCAVPENVGGAEPSQVGQYLITLMGGMSGVNYALFGFVWIRIMYDPRCGLQLGQFTAALLLGYLIFCMTPIATQDMEMNTANWAHAIGMLVGVIAGYLPTVVSPPKKV